MSVILRNRVRCKECNEVIESTFRHDYKTCSCGIAMVDGGTTYLRQNISDKVEYLNRCIPSFDDLSSTTTLTLLDDFKEYNDQFLEFQNKEHQDPQISYDIEQHRFKMYDRMFNKYGWVGRIEDLCFSVDVLTRDLEQEKEDNVLLSKIILGATGTALVLLAVIVGSL